MIRIHHSDADMQKFAKKHKLEVYKEKSIKYEVLSVFEEHKPYVDIYKYLCDNMDSILEGNLETLKGHINIIETLCNTYSCNIEDIFCGKKNSFKEEEVTKNNVKGTSFDEASFSFPDWENGNCIKSKINSLIVFLQTKTGKTLKKKVDILVKFCNGTNNVSISDIKDIISTGNDKWRIEVRAFSDISIFDEYFKLKAKTEKDLRILNNPEAVIFDYDSSAKWTHELIKELGINTCLYCNRNHIHYDFDKKFGTTLDHFYDKATYPYLALSFYNLIPSCNSCNSPQGKGSKPFSLETHLHPYKQGFEGILHFSTSIKNVSGIIDDKDTENFKIYLTQPNRKVPKYTDWVKANWNKKDLILEEQYQGNKSTVKNLLNRYKRYSEVQSKHFHKSWIDVDLFSDEKEAMRIMFDIFPDEKDLHKEVLSKLKRDIAIEYFDLDELKHLK